MPSEIAMPSPNAISPSGLKSNSQFYPYEGSNPRRRPQQDPIGKIISDTFKYGLHEKKKNFTSAAGVFKKKFHFCMVKQEKITERQQLKIVLIGH